MGIFLYFGAVMACLAGVTLVWRGTFLDRLWTAEPAHTTSFHHWGLPLASHFFVLA